RPTARGPSRTPGQPARAGRKQPNRHAEKLLRLSWQRNRGGHVGASKDAESWWPILVLGQASRSRGRDQKAHSGYGFSAGSQTQGTLEQPGQPWPYFLRTAASRSIPRMLASVASQAKT